jgi:hypothetical protein
MIRCALGHWVGKDLSLEKENKTVRNSTQIKIQKVVQDKPTAKLHTYNAKFNKHKIKFSERGP